MTAKKAPAAKKAAKKAPDPKLAADPPPAKPATGGRFGAYDLTAGRFVGGVRNRREAETIVERLVASGHAAEIRPV